MHSFKNLVKVTVFQESVHGVGVGVQLIKATFPFPVWL